MGPHIVDYIPRPLRIIYDNGVVVLYTKNNKTSSDFKFMELNLLTMRDLYKDYAIVVSHVGTNSLLTDPLTKGLRLVILKRQIDNMSIMNSFNLIMLGYGSMSNMLFSHMLTNLSILGLFWWYFHFIWILLLCTSVW